MNAVAALAAVMAVAATAPKTVNDRAKMIRESHDYSLLGGFYYKECFSREAK
jgi:hypothetical protein